jgi:hypothetical protein
MSLRNWFPILSKKIKEKDLQKPAIEAYAFMLYGN